MSDQPIIVAQLEYEGKELIHNDLISSAFNLKERIEKNMEKGERLGIGLDIMAAVTMTAFAFEAYLNFVGFKIIDDFEKYEREAGKKKRRRIMAALALKWDDEVRPFSTINRLISVRDAMAHGKPLYVKDEWEAVGTHNELEEQIRTYRKGIEERVTYDLLCEAYEDVEIIWRMMLKAGKIRYFDTLDGGSSGITFKSYA
ncbi:hypothetical protein [Brevundimonas goettingensis]|uniref:Uncharacterized protein n=1 Tax=Brevundimonas goettingensis TaxID=2774190 RepID=A0A975GWW8_9CAUL|nr:hypothetical protein [Brevundimonas goettingensis]QTC93086.1 hypothetical protein IFJ75_09715 [Brevundimonas goettingensis]